MIFLGMTRKDGGTLWARYSEITCMEERDNDEAMVFVGNVGYAIKHFSQVLATINGLNPEHVVEVKHEENEEKHVPDSDDDGGSGSGE